MHELSELFPLGLTRKRVWTVADSMLYAPGDDAARSTLSSPSMINEMEITAAEALKPNMPEGGFTVGFHVNVKHVAPAPPGNRIETTAKLIDVKGNKFTLAVEAHDLDAQRLIGIGEHRRAAIFP